jgi:hypothetical protein
MFRIKKRNIVKEILIENFKNNINTYVEYITTCDISLEVKTNRGSVVLVSKNKFDRLISKIKKSSS